MVPILVVLAACVVLALAVMPWAQRQRRADDLATVAARNGLHHSGSDPFGCTRVAFSLFHKGDGRSVENVVWRDRPDGLATRAFDYSYYVEARDDLGHMRRSYTRFSCVMAQIDGSWPDVTIQRSHLLDKALSLVGLGDIKLESDEFNRRFALRSPDRRFAVTLVDAQMIDFLMSTDACFAFAVKGRWVLLASDPVAPALVPALMRVGETFVAHIPRVVYELWPSPFRDAQGQPLAAGDDGYGRALQLAELTERDPFASASHPPAAPEPDDKPEYDLDGHLVVDRPQHPWVDGPQPAAD